MVSWLRPVASTVLTAGALGVGNSAAFAQAAAGCPAPIGGGAITEARVATADTARSPGTDSLRAAYGGPDIVLFASVEAQRLQFRSQPQARIRFCWGEGRGDTLRVVERRNLPSPVVAGVTYRDVYVAVELLGHLNATCLLRELGIRNTAPGSVATSEAVVCATLTPRPSRSRP